MHLKKKKSSVPDWCHSRASHIGVRKKTHARVHVPQTAHVARHHRAEPESTDRNLELIYGRTLIWKWDQILVRTGPLSDGSPDKRACREREGGEGGGDRGVGGLQNERRLR